MKYPKLYPMRSALAAALFAVVALVHNPVSAQTTYTWTNTVGGAQGWNTAANWSGGSVPNPVAGDIMNFSTVNIAANTVLTLDADRPAGTWRFADTSGSQTWAISAGNTLTLAGTTPTVLVSNTTLTISSAVAGTQGLTKTGTGTLVLATPNTFSGGINLAAGTLQVSSSVSSNVLGSAANVITFTGTATLHNSGGSFTFHQPIVLNPGSTGTLSGAFGEATTVLGPVSGSGMLIASAGSAGFELRLANTNNPFTGTLKLSFSGGNPSTLYVASLADSANPIQIGNAANQSIFAYDATAATPLVLSNRQVQLMGTTGQTTLRNDTAGSAKPVTIVPDLAIVGTGNKTLVFGGVSTANNTFVGRITNGPGSVISITKADGGLWMLGATNNNYTGPTTISGGALGINSLRNVGGGASSLGAPTTSTNGTIALGSGTATGTLRYFGPGDTSDRVINLAGTTGGGTLDQSGTGLWKLTSVFTATGASNKVLRLQGSTAGGGEIAGVIVDNSASLKTSLTKSGTGTWLLSGANEYTGDTVLNGGVLRAVEGVGLPTNSLLTLNGGVLEPVGDFARAGGTTAGRMRITGGASGFSARGGDVQVAYGTLGSPSPLLLGSSAFSPATLVLNAATADSKLTLLNSVDISGFIFDVRVDAATAEISGNVTGDLTGSLVKSGVGTLIMSGNNTFQGNATVSAGTLTLPQPAFSQYANVTVANAAAIELDFAGTNSVASLMLGDIPKPPGAYSASNAAPYLTGTGVIYVNGGDADEDGMPDGWELLYGLNPNDPADAGDDEDGDALTNLEEYLAGTNPDNADTDGDGLNDGAEILVGSLPLVADTDGDGVLDGEEVTAGASPLLVDTDGDGAADWYEIKATHTHPGDANSRPIVPYPLPRPTASAGTTNKPVKVFILSGQSNMVGMGKVDPLGTPGTLATIVKQGGKFPNFVNANGTWTTNNDVYYRGVVTALGDGPLTAGFGSGDDRLGPELGLGRVLGYALDEPVLLIKASQGNRGLFWDILPPGSPRWTNGATVYAGYGEAPQSWPTNGAPALGGWYAGKQYDDFFLDEPDMGGNDWASGVAYPGSCQVVHNGAGYIAKSAHTSSASDEPGVGGVWTNRWDPYTIENTSDVLDGFATHYPQWAAQGFEIAGYVWWQGHWDSQDSVKASRYETNLVRFIKQLRQYFETRYPANTPTNAPFVLATIGFDGWDMSGNYLTVANAQLAVSDTNKYPQFAGNVKTVESRSYWRGTNDSPSAEGYHYNLNAETYTLVGDALGRGMLEMLGGITDTNPPVLATVSPATGATNVPTTSDLVANFDEVIVAGTGNIIVSNLTDGTFTSIPVDDATQVTANGTALTINPAAYLKANKQFAIRIPAGVIKDYAGNNFAGINDNVTWTFTTGAGSSLEAALVALADHVNGISILSSNQIAAYKTTIDGLKNQIGDDPGTITAAFDLVRAYETVYGPLWIATGAFSRASETGNMQWTIYRVMQAILDYVYTRGNIVSYEELLGTFKFNSSSNFPGVCPVPPTNGVYVVAVNASFTDTFGRDTQGWTDRARRPTGAYLAPGTVASVTVPAALVNAGYKIRVGAHSWDFSNKPNVGRLDRSSLVFDIVATDTKISSPLGGGIYIEAPLNASAGVVNVTITGAARAPFFQNTSFHQTTLSEWLNTERTNAAPWADFQTDKFLMQVPRSWIYAHPDPLSVLNDWDASMDAINDLMGFPQIRGKDTLYLQVDVYARASVYAPGYPTVNVNYNPKTDYGGYSGSYLVRGPQYSPDYVFHEQGHSYFFPKFGGESESAVNFLYVAVLNRKFGESLDSAYRRSFGTYSLPAAGFKDNNAKFWMTSFNFSPREQPMGDWEKDYKTTGYGKFVDIAYLYGWGALNNFWYYYNSNDTYNITVPKGNDDLSVQLCKAAGADVRPLLHFWGQPPVNAGSVSNQVAAQGFTPGVEIYDLLMHYKSILPTNNAQFQAFCLLYFGRQPTMDGYGVEKEKARQWSTNLLNGLCGCTQERFPTEIYDETAYAQVSARVQEIIDLYYPAGRPPANNAKLANLTPSEGGLAPGFSGVTFAYSNVVAYSTTNMTFTPVAADPSATIKVNGTPVPSGAPSGAINVSGASTLVSIVVVSGDTTVTNTYTVTVTHAAPSPNANLANLVPGAGTLSPGFGSGVTNYSATVPFAVSNFTVTPFAAQPGASITVNGSPVASGTPSAPIPMSIGTNIVTTVVVSEDLSATKTYKLTVRRTANAGLGNFTLSAGTLNPAFSTITFSYTASVGFGVNSVTVTPTAADPAATIRVNGSPVASGSPSGVIALNVGVNPITTVVISADASATNTYTLNLTRSAPVSKWWDGGVVNITTNGNGASAGGVGEWDTTIENWDQGNGVAHGVWVNANDDTAVFGGTAATVNVTTNVSAAGLRFDTAGYVLTNSMVTLTGGGTITANSNVTIQSTLAGNVGLTKEGPANLTLTASNIFTGGINLSAGTIQVSSSSHAHALGHPTNVVNFIGNATLYDANGTFTMPQGIAVNNVTATLLGAFGEILVVNGPVSGSGTLVVDGASNGWDVRMQNTTNTITGTVQVFGGSGNATLRIASLADSTNSIQLGRPSSSNGAGILEYQSGATAPLVLSNRPVQLSSTTSSGTIQNNASGANTISIYQGLGITGTGNKSLVLGGANTGANLFAGNITNAASSVISVTKADGGTWHLTGTNTHTGATAVNAGTLLINSIANVGGGASALGAPTTVANGTINLGSGTTTSATLRYNGPGHTTDRVLNLAATTTGGATLDQSGTGLLTFTSGLTSSNTAGNVKTLTLTGSTAGTGEFAGAIGNGTGAGTLAVTKSGTGTWRLSGSNSYSGVTTVNAGKLFVNGDQTAATNVLRVATNATLGGTGIIGGNTTVSNAARLEFNLSTVAASHDKLEVVSGKTFSFLGASVLTITSSGLPAIGTYVLVTAPGGISGSVPATVNLPAGWTASAPAIADGTNLVINITSVGGPATPNPSLLTNSVTGGGTTLSLTWPAGQGWRLQEQTNSRSVGLRTNWVYLTDNSVSSTNIPVDKTKPTTFYRLVYP